MARGVAFPCTGSTDVSCCIMVWHAPGNVLNPILDHGHQQRLLDGQVEQGRQAHCCRFAKACTKYLREQPQP